MAGSTSLTGVPDVGPGYYTVSQQMVCETLGLPPEKVGVVFKDTDSLPFDPGTGGSKQTNTSGHAVNQSAHEVREKLVNLAARELGCLARGDSAARRQAERAEQEVDDHAKDDRAGCQRKRRLRSFT